MKILLLVAALLIQIIGYTQNEVFVNTDARELYKLDLLNCNSTFIGSDTILLKDIAFTSDMKMWGVGGSSLYSVDTLNGKLSYVGNIGISPKSLVGLDDTILLAEYSRKLYRINTNDASIQFVGSLLYTSSGDLAWYDNNLYLTTKGRLIRIILNATNTAIDTVETDTSLSISGLFWGLATSKTNGKDKYLVGFEGKSAYKFCEIDFTYEDLCPKILGITTGTKINGAAAKRFPSQNPPRTDCESTINVEQFDKKPIVKVSPNPTSNWISVESIEDFHTLNIKNISGKTVVQYKYQMDGRYKMPEPSGLYFILLEKDGRFVGITKIIKK